MKIYIHYQFSEGPFGGGNQFLKALREEFSARGAYAEDAAAADIILFNSFDGIPGLLQLRARYPEKIFVHRVDGPIRLYNQMGDPRDSFVNFVNSAVADATVFQSEWSKRRNLEMGIHEKERQTVVTNAPNPKIFHPSTGNADPGPRFRIISASWSDNPKKGFATYRWLDENLDFTRFEMTFVGRSPVNFQNIRAVGPKNSHELAALLREHDLFLTASENDPCSNSLLEGLHTGLPALALNSGGHPELVKAGGLLFSQPTEIPAALEKIRENYGDFRQKISVVPIGEVAGRYLEFLRACHQGKPAARRGTLLLPRARYFFLRLQARRKGFYL